MTSTPGKLCALTGPMNTYQDGKLGAIEVDAYADLLTVDGKSLGGLAGLRRGFRHRHESRE